MGIAVLDVGTSSMRGVLYNDKGEKLFTDQASYSPVYLAHGWVEQNPLDWKMAMERTMKACVDYAGEKGERIEAVSITSQRSSVIPIGEDETPCSHAIMWQDKRVLGALNELAPYNSRIFKLAGSRINPVFSGSKMLWIRTCSPHLYKKLRRLVVIPDYLIHEMTGEWVTDATYGSRSLLMNLKSRKWDEELLDYFKVHKEKLCRLVEPGSVAGRINKTCAGKTGLLEGTPVITSGGDQQCAALGMGVFKQGDMGVSAGTGAYIIGASKVVPKDLKEDVVCNASAVPGEYVLESSILSCASVFNWCLRLCYGLNDKNQKEIYQIVNRDMETSLKKQDAPVMLPFFQGRGTPDWNSQARGCIHNLNLGTERGDLARAALEGICYEIAVNLEAISHYAGKAGRISTCGGLANSGVFLKILSNVCQSSLDTYSDNEAAVAGAWISAAVTLGLYPEYKEAFRQSIKGRQAKETQPEKAVCGQYALGRKRYKELYEKLYIS